MCLAQIVYQFYLYPYVIFNSVMAFYLRFFGTTITTAVGSSTSGESAWLFSLPYPILDSLAAKHCAIKLTTEAGVNS